MRVVAVVLNWRRPTDTISCVTSLLKTAPGLDVIVVDNGSADGSVEQIRAAHPVVRLIENEDNLGYAGGNNVGIRAAIGGGAEAVFVVNNDVVVRPGCVERLVDLLERDAGLGIVGPLSVRGGPPDVVDFLSAQVDLKNMALVAHERDRPVDLDVAPHAMREQVQTDYVTGSALMARADLLDRLGGFDERFFLVWEDVDLALRARQMGQRLAASPRAHVTHGRSVSFGGEGSPLYWYFFVRNSFLVLAEHGRRPWRARTKRMIERRYRTLSERGDGPVERAMALGLEHGLSQRWGPPPSELMP